MTKLAVIILAAGQGTRMKSRVPKVLHSVAGTPMLAHVLGVAKALGASRIVTVVAPGADAVSALVASRCGTAVVQDKQLGTGHAVLAAEAALKNFTGTILVLFGDTPLITEATLKKLLKHVDAGADICGLGFRPEDPAGYGRMVVENGALTRIVEHKDASGSERGIGLCFAGMMAAKAGVLFGLLHKVDNKNAQGEFYLTDVIALARESNKRAEAEEGPVDEMMGVNSRTHLSEAEGLFQARARKLVMEAGVTMADPSTVYFSADTVIEPDVSIGPNVVFGPGVIVRSGVEIKSFCHIEGADIGAGSIIGPFARLRPGAKLDANVHVGNFVEVKNSRLEEGVKANHFTYLGDAFIGARTNIGAGTITCNYDGQDKHKTEIGADSFIGSNSTLVAPLKIGAGAYVAAGSVITKTVEDNSLALGRAEQTTKPGWATRLRAARKARKGK